MTTIAIKDEVRKPAVKNSSIAEAGRKGDFFKAIVLRYAADKKTTKAPALLLAASGTRLRPHIVIRRCAVLSSHAFVCSKSPESMK